MISATVDTSQLEIKAQRIGATASTFRPEMKRTMSRVAIILQRRVKQKLSGDVLNVRTNNLRSSIMQRVEENDAEISAVVDTKVKYARVHEYGFKGSVFVPSFMRRTQSGSCVVRAHKRTMNMPQRSFLRSSLIELKDEIVEMVNKSAAGKIREINK